MCTSATSGYIYSTVQYIYLRTQSRRKGRADILRARKTSSFFKNLKNLKRTKRKSNSMQGSTEEKSNNIQRSTKQKGDNLQEV